MTVCYVSDWLSICIVCACFFQAMDNVRRSQSSDVLSEAEEVSAFLFELAHFFHEWRFTLPDVLILLLVTLRSFFFLYWYHRRPKLHEMAILRSSDRGENILIFTSARLLGRLNTVKFSKNPYLASTVFRSCLTAYLGNVESHKWKWRRLYYITKNLL